MKNISLLSIFVFIFKVAFAQTPSCGSGGCSAFTNQYPSSTFSTSSSSWTQISPYMNAGNYTLCNVTQGNTYQWTYSSCAASGYAYQNWDSQITLYDINDLTTPLCFQDDANGAPQNCWTAPYMEWTATFTGTVVLLTTAWISGNNCQTNTGAPYSALAWRQSAQGSGGGGGSTACSDPLEPNNTYSQPAVTTNGFSNTNLCINPAGEYDYFSIDCGNGQIYYFDIEGYDPTETGDYALNVSLTGGTLTIETSSVNGSTLDTYINLYDTDGTTILDSDDDGGSGLFSLLTYTLSCNGGGGNEDVFISNESVSTSSANVGDIITVSCDQNYTGGATSNYTCFLYYVLSTDCNYDAGVDSILDNAESSTIGTDSGDAETENVTIPNVPSGAYFILFVGDATNVVNPEIDSTNNIACVPITIIGNCTYTFTPTINLNVPTNGGTYTINVTTQAGCTVTATSNCPSVTTTVSGSVVTYTVVPNTSPNVLNCSIDINGVPFDIEQAALICTYTLSPTSATNMLAAGGVGTFNITTGQNCPKIPVPSCAWVTASISGNVVTYNVLANTSSTSRTCTIDVEGQVFTIQQNGCTLPATPTITGQNTICANTPVTLSTSNINGASYDWFLNGVSVGASNTYIATAAGTYTVAVTNTCGSVTSTNFVITNAPAIGLTASPTNNTICLGASVTLYASTSVSSPTYSWVGNGLSATNIASPTATPTSAGAQNYTVFATKNGCTEQQSFSILVNALPPAPTITPANPSPSCSPVQLTANGSVVWSTGQTGSAIFATSTGTYSATTTNAAGCTSANSNVVNVTINTSIPASIQNLGVTYCVNANSVTLSSSPSGGTYTGNGISGNVFNPALAGVGTHTIVYTVTQGTCTGTDTKQVTVTALPNVAITSSQTSICIGSSVTLTGTGATSYSWAGTALNTNSGNTVTASPSTVGTHNYSLTGYANGCYKNEGINITVNSVPSTPIIAPPNPAVTCNGGTISISTPQVGSQTYTWNGNSNLTGNTVAVPAGNYTVVTYLNNCSSPASNSIAITNENTPTTPIVSALNQIICPNETTTLNIVNPNANYDYIWSNGSQGTNTNIGAGTYTVIATSPYCGSSPSSIPIQIQEEQASIQPFGNGCYLMALPANGTYQWFLDGNPINNANSQFFTATATGFYEVLVTTQNNCTIMTNPAIFADCGTLAIEEMKNDFISLYPNPNNGDFHLSYPAILNAEKAVIYDGMGKQISQVALNGNSDSQEIHLANIAKGIYYLVLTTKNDKNYALKFVVE